MKRPNTAHEAAQEGANYTIRVAGRLDETWSDWFDGFTICRCNGETLLTGWVADQAALHGILAKISHLNLALLSVERLEPSQAGFRSQGDNS